MNYPPPVSLIAVFVWPDIVKSTLYFVKNMHINFVGSKKNSTFARYFAFCGVLLVCKCIYDGEERIRRDVKLDNDF